MKWYANLKTSTKLITSFMLVAVLAGALGAYSLFNLNTARGTINNIFENNVRSIELVSQAQITYMNIRVKNREFNASSTDEKINSLRKEVGILIEEVKQLVDSYRQLATSDEEKKVLLDFDVEWNSYTSSYQALYDAALQHNQDLYNQNLASLSEKGTQLTEAFSSLVAYNLEEAEISSQQAEEQYNATRMNTFLILGAVVLLSLLVGYMNTQMINRPLRRVVEVVQKVADGDLREHAGIQTKDEIGQMAVAVDKMVENLRGIIHQIADSSSSLAASSEEISASTQEIASGNSNQAYSVQKISELFAELNRAVDSVAVSAEEASELSNRTANTAADGSKVVSAAITGMQGVNEKIVSLEQDSVKVGDIIELIDDIAEQTNLLALNAAIEAARAGDQGRGFAVVADEVRKLAERSGEATKEITTIIRAMQDNIKQSTVAVADTASRAAQTEATFNHIIEMINDSAYKVNEIAAASEEQSAQASEVLANIESIAAASEEASAASEETAATSQVLAGLADDLNTSVARFKL